MQHEPARPKNEASPHPNRQRRRCHAGRRTHPPLDPECCAADHHNDPALIDAWLRNKTAANVAAWIAQPGSYCVVALSNDQAIGFAMAEAHQLLLCYVLPEHLYQGIGRALLQAVESHAGAQGITRLQLESTRTARAFYERNGFAPDGPAITAFGMTSQPMMKRLPDAPGAPT